MLILKLRNNSALHSKISSAVMLLFVGRKQTLLRFEGTHTKDCYATIPTSQ